MENTRRYADIVEERMKKIDINFVRQEVGEDTGFAISVSGSHVSSLNVKFLIDQDGEAKYRCYIIDKVPKNTRMAVLEECNRLNSIYRYVNFSLDAEDGVCVGYDFSVFGDEEIIGDHVMDMLALCMSITDSHSEYIMKKLLEEESNEEEPSYINMNLFLSEGE